jgi:hypothetical protein
MKSKKFFFDCFILRNTRKNLWLPDCLKDELVHEIEDKNKQRE